MSLESATFVNDLDSSNPVSGDKRKQGDDHLRLIKAVLKATFLRATKAWSMPDCVSKTGNYSVVSTDDNMTIVCDTSGGAFTLTLPTLAAGLDGWCVYVLKTTSDANPVFIAPPSGTINGHSKVRRSVAHQLIKVLWTGSVFVAQRTFGVPVGTLIPNYSTTLQQGCLWPDGTTFTAADYVELNTHLGGNTKPDARGRTLACKDDVGGVSANRLTSPINGDTLGAAGGAESVTLVAANIPELDLESGVATSSGDHEHDCFSTTNSDDPLSAGEQAADASTAGTYTMAGTNNAATVGDTSTAGAHTHTVEGTVGEASPTAVTTLPPTIVVPYMIVAE